MMMSIVEQGQISFKTLEQKIFAYVCELGREITRTMLEEYDAELAAGRDRSRYRDKGKEGDDNQDGLWGGVLLPQGVPDEAGGWPEGLCVSVG